MSFESDIQGQNTQLYPVVEIDGQFYSTNNVTIGDNYCKPILMNIPSIKESIDVESRKFKISNVSLQFNNFPFDGVRFSDQLSASSLINTEATIYFKSQSTNTVEDMHEAYKGIIRRISHDDTKVGVELEDLTERKAHKDLPQALDQNGVVGVLGTGESIPDKYKNAPIPMVYGHVDRSPVVISENFRKYQADSKDIEGFIEISSGFTKANTDGIWLDSLQVDIDGEFFHIVRGNQYEYGDNSIGLLSTIDDLEEIDEVSLVCRKIARPKLNITNTSYNSEYINEDYLDPEYTIDNITNITDGLNVNNPIGLLGKYDSILSLGASYGNEIGAAAVEHILLSINMDVIPQHDTVGDKNDIIGFKINGRNLPEFLGDKIVKANHINGLYGSINNISLNYDTDYLLIWDESLPHYNDFNQTFGFTGFPNPHDDMPDNYSDIAENADIKMDFHAEAGSYPFLLDMPVLLFFGGFSNTLKIQFRVVGDTVVASDYTGSLDVRHRVEVSGNIDEIGMLIQNESLKLFNNDFYANVKGRLNTEGDFIDNPIDIIYDLVKSELGHDAINEDEYEQAKLQHTDWKFGFTVSKKTNSKKLIQEIAKSTKCFPKFKNDGTFGFNTIKDSYAVDNDYNGATPIKESEVISYSFKKTKPEQIYKKVDVQYNKDYAQDSYSKRTDEIDLGVDDYYGIEASSDAYLEFESDYIRDEDTANALTSFLSEQYKNDHLLFNLKLPLQYINLEIGDLVKFESLFQDLSAYGIDYRILEDINGQYRYPLFMVTSTQKNLDSVSIECMQLHHLSGDIDTNWESVTFPDSDDIVIIQPPVEEDPVFEEGEQIEVPFDYINIEVGTIEFLEDDGVLLFDYTLYNMFNPISFIKVEQAGHISQIFKVTANPYSNIFNLTPYLGMGHDISQFTGDLLITAISTESIMFMGDANLDGTLNILDIVSTMNYILGVGTIEAEYNADVNLDDNVNILDIVKMMNCILGTGSCDFG